MWINGPCKCPADNHWCYFAHLLETAHFTLIKHLSEKQLQVELVLWDVHCTNTEQATKSWKLPQGRCEQDEIVGWVPFGTGKSGHIWHEITKVTIARTSERDGTSERFVLYHSCFFFVWWGYFVKRRVEWFAIWEGCSYSLQQQVPLC